MLFYTDLIEYLFHKFTCQKKSIYLPLKDESNQGNQIPAFHFITQFLQQKGKIPDESLGSYPGNYGLTAEGDFKSGRYGDESVLCPFSRLSSFWTLLQNKEREREIDREKEKEGRSAKGGILIQISSISTL